MTTTPPVSQEPPDYPMPVARLARLLGVHRSTLGRALRAVGAPGPDDTDPVTKAPLYRYATIHAWWPHRRQRGQRGQDRAPRQPRSSGAPR